MQVLLEPKHQFYLDIYCPSCINTACQFWILHYVSQNHVETSEQESCDRKWTEDGVSHVSTEIHTR